MSDLRILHVTDLHLADFSDTSENLRKAFYKEYIDGLHAKVTEVINEPIDLIVSTGDFVDKGRTENYPYVRVILDYLASKFAIKKDLIATCLGNHDFVLTEDAAGREQKAREAYSTFAKNYNKRTVVAEKDFFTLYKDDTLNRYILSFDSTLGCKGLNIPSSLTDAQIDEVITCVDENIPSENLLVILSHYPMIIFNRSTVASQVDNWVDEHLWKSGHIIVERIYKKRPNGLTLWFFGDAHIPDFWSYNQSHHFLMTGMLGGNYKKQTTKAKNGDTVAYNKTNEAKIFSISSPGDIVIHTFSYQSKGYQHSVHTGEWIHHVSATRIVDNPFATVKVSTEAPTSPFDSKIQTAEIPNKLEVISTSVQEEIMVQIRERKLYSFNRFATSQKDVSLGWVSVTKLFESNELLSRCIEKTVDWLRNKTELKYDKENTIFIGIDFWGAIFASQCSLIMDIENYCIATKLKAAQNVLFEKPEFLKDKLAGKFSTIENIVLFADVISTGNTIVELKKKIKEMLPPDKKINWLAASIISDGRQISNNEITDFFSIGALCTTLKIPVLSVSDLPPEDILPIKFSMV